MEGRIAANLFEWDLGHAPWWRPGTEGRSAARADEKSWPSTSAKARAASADGNRRAAR